MQVMFLVLFGVSLVTFSLVVRAAVKLLPYVIEGRALPGGTVVGGLAWGCMFVLSFLGTGAFLYERERDEGRVSRRIRLFDWILDGGSTRSDDRSSTAKPTRRA